MTENVKGKQLVERFNKFVEYRKAGKKAGESSFTERMADLVRPADDKTGSSSQEPPAQEKIAEKTGEKTEQQAPMRSGRRHQPPRLARAKSITQVQAQRLARLAPMIEDAAKRHNVPVELICGVILQESGGNARAVSHAGAKGLMQLMPGTAKRFGVTDSFDPRQNIEGGTRYLRWLMDRFHGNIELALAGYNAGEGNVEKYGNKVPPFAETKAYIPNVLGYTQAMVDIFYAKMSSNLPNYARRV